MKVSFKPGVFNLVGDVRISDTKIVCSVGGVGYTACP